MTQRRFTVEDPACSGMRADRFVAEHLELFTRSQLKSRRVAIEINGKESKWSHRLDLGDLVELSWEPETATEPVAEAVDFEVLFENEDVVVVNKPQGLVVHPAAGNYHGTLVQGLAFRSRAISESLSAENPRPGIVHRLDKDTSGVIIAAKNPEARQFLANQFAKKHTAKVYLAIVKGTVMPSSGRIESRICRDPKNRKRFTVSEVAGKTATTDYTVVHQWKNHALVSLRPQTGRTHQLRVHLSSRGHAILGDPLYARKDPRLPEATLMLHARRLTIMLPRREPDPQRPEGYHYVGGETVEFRAPLPERFKSLIRLLSNRALGADA